MPVPSHAARSAASATILTAFLALLYELDRRGLVPSLLRMAPGHGHVIVYGVTAAAAFGCAMAPAGWRRAILLAAALIAAPAALGVWAAVLVAHVAWVIAIARAPLPVLAQVAAALVVWLAVPVARCLWLDGDAQADTILLAILWTGQLYAALYVIVERAREAPGHRARVLDDACYLLALPRLVVPFFQPISPRQLLRAERAAPPWRLIARAAALAAYAAGVAVLAVKLGAVARHVHPRPLALVVKFGRGYAHATYAIFTAVAVFRLLGYHLPSGFRTPFLSRSFAEFFRRFNYYVRDAVLSLFYYPLLGHLRHHLAPRAATIVSAYLAILAGSFLLHDVLVPISTTIEPASTIGYYLDPVRVLGFVALWTLIIVPSAGIAPRRPPPRSRTRVVLGVVAFNAVYLALWYAQVVGRGRL